MSNAAPGHVTPSRRTHTSHMLCHSVPGLRLRRARPTLNADRMNCRASKRRMACRDVPVATGRDSHPCWPSGVADMTAWCFCIQSFRLTAQVGWSTVGPPSLFQASGSCGHKRPSVRIFDRSIDTSLQMVPARKAAKCLTSNHSVSGTAHNECACFTWQLLGT